MLDARLGTLPRGVHDLHAHGAGDAAAARGFALGLMARIDGPVLLVETEAAAREHGRPHAPGLAALGLDPGRLLVVRVPDEPLMLWAAEEAVRCGAVAGVVACHVAPVGSPRRYDLTASRRLSLAAARTGATALMLHQGQPDGAETPTAALTRWRIAALPSADPDWRWGVGPPAFEACLVRRRSGPALTLSLVWSCHERRFVPLPHTRTPSVALPGGRPAAPAGRAGQAGAGQERAGARAR